MSFSASLYEQLFPLTTVMRQRVVENFSGATLNERWTTNLFVSAPTFQMSDAINGGFEIVTIAQNNTGGSIFYNNVARQYDNTSSVIIWVDKQETNANVLGGLTNNHVGFSIFRNCAYINETAGEASLFLNVGNASSSTQINLSTNPSTTQKSKKIECKAASVEASVNNVLEGIATTNLPVAALQPRWGYRAVSATVSTGRVRYLEAFNT